MKTKFLSLNLNLNLSEKREESIDMNNGPGNSNIRLVTNCGVNLGLVNY